MAYKNNLITGITELLVLKILEQQDSYVYEIQKMINNNSEHLLSISLNTIYTVTYKLENENLISEYSKLVGKKKNTSILPSRRNRERVSHKNYS